MLAAAACGLAQPQVTTPQVTTPQVTTPQADGTVPIYRIQVTSRTIRAVNYRVRSSDTNIDFKGTALMPEARGRGQVDDKKGSYEVKADFERLSKPQSFGAEYLTYVLWAVTPEGRPRNMGEVIVDGERGRIQASTELQAFGMIVTAEPYFAVSTPSNVVVLENIIRDDTYGTNKPIEAKYELFERGEYSGAQLQPVMERENNREVPTWLHQARAAMQIARWQGAETWAADTFQRAKQSLTNAEAFQTNPTRDDRRVTQNAREAAQTFEDARVLAVRRSEEARVAREQSDAASRARQAERQAESEAEARARAERERRQAEASAAQAAASAAQAEQRQQKAESERMMAQVRAERARLEAERAAQEAQRAAQEGAAAKEAAARALAEQRQLRAMLLQRFNQILETRDTPRGLVVNIGDVLFDTGKADLRAPAREALAKLSGIVLAYPSLKLDVEGHTDSTGGDELNQRLSEQRAASVRDYLVSQQLPADHIQTRGFGKTQPVADNGTAEGRQRNRRVEIVVSGEVIGTEISEVRPSSNP